jgi:hypothetical protein
MLGLEAGYGRGVLRGGVLTLGVESGGKFMQEHVFFWIWGNRWCGEVGGGGARNGEG